MKGRKRTKKKGEMKMKEHIERMAREEKKSIAYGDEFWTTKFMRSRWKIPVVVSVASVIMASLVVGYMIPQVFGANFVSCSFELYGTANPFGHWGWVVIWPDGRTVRLGCVGVRYYWNNSYFMPVQLHYNGFDFVMLVYNRTVNNPTDVIANREFLVWGAFFASGFSFFTSGLPCPLEGSYFDFYASRRNLSNYTVTMPTAINDYGSIFDYIDDPGAWVAHDLNGNLVPLGTYYIYFIFYGIVAKPSYLSLTVVRYEGVD